MSTASLSQAKILATVPATVVRLLPVSARAPRLEFKLDELPLVFGRDHSVDVLLHDPWVSRRHCELVALGPELVVRDLESKHGTYVNDMMIIDKYLQPGDELSIGLSTFRVAIGDA